MPSLRNPGPWTFAIFACACFLVGFLSWRGYPEGVKLAASLVGILVAAFGAKSALGVQRAPDRNASEAIAEVAKLALQPHKERDASKAIAEVAKLSRPPMQTWPGADDLDELDDTTPDVTATKDMKPKGPLPR